MQAGQVPAELAPDVVQRLERRMAELTHASSMGDKLVFMNATRIMFNLTADALSPLMAMYEVGVFLFTPISCVYRTGSNVSWVHF